MKSFWKNCLIALTIGIVLTSLISQSTSTGGENQSVAQEVSNFDEEVEAGLIIKDGILNEKDEEFKVDNGNKIGETTSVIGGFITRIITKILQLLASLISKILS